MMRIQLICIFPNGVVSSSFSYEKRWENYTFMTKLTKRIFFSSKIDKKTEFSSFWSFLVHIQPFSHYKFGWLIQIQNSDSNLMLICFCLFVCLFVFWIIFSTLYLNLGLSMLRVYTTITCSIDFLYNMYKVGSFLAALSSETLGLLI